MSESSTLPGGLPFHHKSYVCSHVHTAERPVLYVVREDGDWMFLCGMPDHEQSNDSFAVAGIGHVFESDPSLVALLDLGPNETAERPSVDEEWERSATEPGSAD